MLKKIGVGFLIVLLVGAGIGYKVYKKAEDEFESFMLSELKREEALMIQESKKKEEEENQKKLREEIKEKEAKEASEKLAKEKEIEIELAKKLAEDAAQKLEETKKINEEKVAASTKEKEKLEAQRLEKEKLEAELIALEKLEEERLAAEKLAKEKLEKERLAADKLEEERILAEQKLIEDTENSFTSDKAKAMALATKKLTAAQIIDLMDMAEGGFTKVEKAKAKEMFYSNFTEEEQTWILDVYKKHYGNI